MRGLQGVSHRAAATVGLPLTEPAGLRVRCLSSRPGSGSRVASRVPSRVPSRGAGGSVGHKAGRTRGSSCCYREEAGYCAR